MDFLGIILASIIFMNFGICVKNEELLHKSKSLINFYLENTIIFHSRPIFFYCATDMNVANNHQELFFFLFGLFAHWSENQCISVTIQATVLSYSDHLTFLNHLTSLSPLSRR